MTDDAVTAPAPAPELPWTYLKDEPLCKLDLPVHTSTWYATGRFVFCPVGAIKTELDLVASAQATVGDSLGSRAVELDAHLALGTAEAHVGLGEQKCDGVPDAIVGPGDGDFAADGPRWLVWQVGIELGDGGEGEGRQRPVEEGVCRCRGHGFRRRDSGLATRLRDVGGAIRTSQSSIRDRGGGVVERCHWAGARRGIDCKRRHMCRMVD